MTKNQPPKELLKQWRRRLAQEGFHDLENEYVHSTGEGLLSSAGAAPDVYVEASPTERDALASSSADALEVLRHHRFKANRDRRIWALHAEGATVRDIAAEMGMPVGTVHYNIRRIEGQVMVGRRGGGTSLRAMVKRADLRTLFALGELVVRLHG